MMPLLLLSLAVGGLEWRALFYNSHSPYNGLGAIPGTLTRDNAAPMRYRVLVPWMLAPVPERWRGWLYQPVRTLLFFFALVAVEQLLGMRAALVVALLAASVIEYDYWDCYAELLGVALCLSNNVILVALGAALWGLSRETAALAPILALVASGPAAGLMALTGPTAVALVRAVQGHADLYCERWTFRVYNLTDLRAMRRDRDITPLVSIAWTVATVAVVLFGRGAMPGPLARTAPLAMVWIAAGWMMARARETRVFMPVALWLAGAV